VIHQAKDFPHKNDWSAGPAPARNLGGRDARAPANSLLF